MQSAFRNLYSPLFIVFSNFYKDFLIVFPGSTIRVIPKSIDNYGLCISSDAGSYSQSLD